MTDKTYTVEELEALGVINKNTPASTSLTAPTVHGPMASGTSTTQFGIFSAPGVRPEMYSTLVRPDNALSLVSLNRSRYTNELIETLTGVTDPASFQNATGFCGDPPEVGQGKVAQRLFKFGDYYAKTRLNAVPKLGQYRNRADVPREILNMGPEMNPLIPDIMYNPDFTDSQLQYELWQLGVSLERSLSEIFIQGTAAGSGNFLGWTSEFDGLDAQIKTNYTDAVTGTEVPALDSAVLTFGSDVAGTDANGDNVVQALTDLVYGLQQRAADMGMSAQWAFIMRKEAFRSLTEVWACNYATYRCDVNTGAGNPVNQNATETNRLRLEMLQGNYLLVDGARIPVVFSEGIPRRTIAANNFESDIYLVAVSANGRSGLNMEYFPMDNPNAQQYANFTTSNHLVLNNGLYLVGREETAMCIEYHIASSMRLIVEWPWLCGRLDNLQYTFRAPIRNSDPSDTWWYANGGATYRS